MTDIPENPLTNIGNEILSMLPILMKMHPAGPTVGEVAGVLALDHKFARSAMKQLDADERAIFMRYKGSRTWHLLPILHVLPKLHICKNCRVTFDRPEKSKRQCCSGTCSQSWAWTLPGTRERRSAGIKIQKQSPEGVAHIKKLNEHRWGDEEQHRKMSEFNKKRWLDPVYKAEMTVKHTIRGNQPDARKLSSELAKAKWANKELRDKMSASMRKTKQTPGFKEKFSEMLKERWRDPVLRKKYTEANRVRSLAIAEKNRGKPQSPEHIAKRVASFKARKAAKRKIPIDLI